MDLAALIIATIPGLAAAIPLVIELIRYIRKAAKEKNWNRVLAFVMDRMKEAEGKFATGEERKEWVLMSLKASADAMDYDIDIEAISALIDSLSDLTKAVNVEAHVSPVVEGKDG